MVTNSPAYNALPLALTTNRNQLLNAFKIWGLEPVSPSPVFLLPKRSNRDELLAEIKHLKSVVLALYNGVP